MNGRGVGVDQRSPIRKFYGRPCGKSDGLNPNGNSGMSVMTVDGFMILRGERLVDFRMERLQRHLLRRNPNA